ncbi:MAG: hypothetical protein RDV41_12115 [Planctomycetota bacterium]|nr:hypothetical protein [Planctomycetota bacterium]
MSLELLSRLKEAEAVAAARVKESEALALRDVEEMRETAKVMVQEARLKAVQEVRMAEEAAAKDAQNDIGSLKRDTLAEEDLVRRKVTERMPEAIALVLKAADLAG